MVAVGFSEFSIRQMSAMTMALLLTQVTPSTQIPSSFFRSASVVAADNKGIDDVQPSSALTLLNIIYNFWGFSPQEVGVESDPSAEGETGSKHLRSSSGLKSEVDQEHGECEAVFEEPWLCNSETNIIVGEKDEYSRNVNKNGVKQINVQVTRRLQSKKLGVPAENEL